MPTYDQTEAARARYENRYEASIRRALIQQGAQAVAMWEASGSPELAAAVITKNGLQQALEVVYEKAGDYFAKEAYDQLTTQKSIKAAPPTEVRTGWLSRLKNFISTEGAQRLSGMVETTREQVRKVLSQVVAEGQSVAEGAKTLRQHIATISKARATTIIRTEVVAASNAGSFFGAQATGVALDKFWIATKDSRTRADHIAADRQTVGMNDTFLVGGYAARYPGDPMLPAAQIIRCRCSLGYRPKS
ncbi:phage head morphogenesis protein [Hymenobacter aerilatus]|uniref:Phage head morphogenesis protein n=1 Tax=Hymenobacter aerilatus TaxID=2932251 RepID=A0A8T9T5P9_9BACT|nr:phage minor head protein [Hymenobacter aerilatus]UOR07169.1 phage head morphogenesis protein [Hymenobacter aerilatus]